MRRYDRVVKRNIALAASLAVILTALGLFIWRVSHGGQAALTHDTELIIRAVRMLGPWAPLAFVVAYVALILCLVPTLPLTLAVGVCYGPYWGTLLATFASTLGAVVAFTLARRLGRDWVRSHLSGRLAAWDMALGRQGFWAVFLIRLVPVSPFEAVNVAAALSDVRFRDFVLATALGVIPGGFAYTSLGHAAQRPTWLAVVPSLALLAVLGLSAALLSWRRRVMDGRQAGGDPSLP